MIRYGWTWGGIFSEHITMAPWLLGVLIAVILIAAFFFIYSARSGPRR